MMKLWKACKTNQLYLNHLELEQNDAEFDQV